MKILLVDDSRFLRLANQRALTKAGHMVTAVVDGEEALRAVHEDSFDLIVLDMLLPKIPGLTVLRNLKADSATKDIPVIVLSSLSGANATKLREEGAAAYVVKADDMLEKDSAVLVEAIESALRNVHRPKGRMYTN
jgi:CheY-like chemotaxis protein